MASDPNDPTMGEETKPIKKDPPALAGFFKTKKAKKPGAGSKKKEEEKKVDEWADGEPEEVDQKVADVKVEDLAKKADEDAKDEEAKGPIWKKKDGEEKERKLNEPSFPTLGATVKKSAPTTALPTKAAGFKTHANQFAELHNDDQDDEDKAKKAKKAAEKRRTREEVLAAERKAEKKAQKKAEKEEREAKLAAEQEKENEDREHVCKIDGVKDTEIKADLLAVQEKFNGRRKLEAQPLDERDVDVTAARKKNLDSSDDEEEASESD